MRNHLFVFFWFFLLFFAFFSKVRVGAKEGGSHYWEMAVAITCGYGGYLLPLLAAHSSLCCFTGTSVDLSYLAGFPPLYHLCCFYWYKCGTILPRRFPHCIIDVVLLAQVWNYLTLPAFPYCITCIYVALLVQVWNCLTSPVSPHGIIYVVLLV